MQPFICEGKFLQSKQKRICNMHSYVECNYQCSICWHHSICSYKPQIRSHPLDTSCNKDILFYVGMWLGKHIYAQLFYFQLNCIQYEQLSHFSYDCIWFQFWNDAICIFLCAGHGLYIVFIVKHAFACQKTITYLNNHVWLYDKYYLLF